MLEHKNLTEYQVQSHVINPVNLEFHVESGRLKEENKKKFVLKKVDNEDLAPEKTNPDQQPPPHNDTKNHEKSEQNGGDKFEAPVTRA